MQQLHNASSNSSAPMAAAATAASANSWSGAINAEIPESDVASSAAFECRVAGADIDVNVDVNVDDDDADDNVDDDDDDKPSMEIFHFDPGRLTATTRLEIALRYFMGWNMSSVL